MAAEKLFLSPVCSSSLHTARFPLRVLSPTAG